MGTEHRELVDELAELVAALGRLLARAHELNLPVRAEVRSARKTLGRWLGDLQGIIPPER
jgi:hypothetical protein